MTFKKKSDELETLRREVAELKLNYGRLQQQVTEVRVLLKMPPSFDETQHFINQRFRDAERDKRF